MLNQMTMQNSEPKMLSVDSRGTKDNTRGKFMVFVNPVNSPLEFPFFMDGDNNILEVVLPSFVDLFHLSSEVELCPSPYCNWAMAELLWLEHIVSSKRLASTTQETPVQTVNDLVVSSLKRRA